MGFRLVTLNLNGIRSAANKGFLAWAEKAGADCMCVQEIKAQATDVAGRFERIGTLRGHFHYAQKRGYSGVGVYARKKPSEVIVGLRNREFDTEGRYVEARFDIARRPFSVISCYFPSGSAGEHRQLAKYRFLDVIYPHLLRLKKEREFILVGDINIAHQEIDLKNWKSNQKNSGFLPEERAWLTKLFDRAGPGRRVSLLERQTGAIHLVEQPRQARANNVGWRLDYHLATPGVAAKARREAIYLDQRFSDHAPVTVDYDFAL